MQNRRVPLSRIVGAPARQIAPTLANPRRMNHMPDSVNATADQRTQIQAILKAAQADAR